MKKILFSSVHFSIFILYYHIYGNGGVDVFSGQHTNALDRATRGGAPCSACYVERSDRSEEPIRPVAVQNGDDPTNAHPGGTPLGQAHVGLP